jgi:hypothetical protein
VFNPNSQGGTKIYVQTTIATSELGDQSGGAKAAEHQESDSDSEDSDYVPCSDDGGKDDETMHLRKFAKQYKKKL